LSDDIHLLLKQRIMKRILLSVVLLAGIICIAFLPVSSKKSVEINASIYRISDQLVFADAAVKWLLPFAEEESRNIRIDNGVVQKISDSSLQVVLRPRNSMTTEIIFSPENKPRTFTFSILTNDSTNRKNTVTLVYKTTLLNKITGLNKSAALAEKSLVNLKSYMEDPLQLYGYDIRVTTVKDTSFLVKQITVKKEELSDKAEALFAELIAFAEKNNGNFTGVKIFHRERITKDEYDISAGIGVTKSFPVLAGNGIEYKMMPLGKNLLITTYTGLYGDIDKAYEAIDQFKKDNALSSMAISFERIPDGVTRLADSEIVKLEICYPIF
jgi:effector-binding domain-containing protein